MIITFANTKIIKIRAYLSRLRSTLSFKRQQSFRRLSPVRRTEYEGKVRSEVSGGLPPLSQGWEGRRSAAKMSISCKSSAMQSNRHTWSSKDMSLSEACGLPSVKPLEEEVLGFSCSLVFPAVLWTRSFFKKTERQETYS